MDWLELVLGSRGSGAFLWLLVLVAVGCSVIAFVLDCRGHRERMMWMERETLSERPSEEPPGNSSPVAPHRPLAGSTARCGLPG